MRIAAGALLVLALTACGGEEEGPAAAVADLRCSSTMLSVTPRVEARADGVHVLAQVSQEHGVSLSVDDRPLRGATVMKLSTGDHRVRCSHGDGGSMESSFEVVAESSS